MSKEIDMANESMVDQFIKSKELVNKLTRSHYKASIWSKYPYQFEISHVSAEFEETFEYDKWAVVNAPENGVMAWVDDNFFNAWLVYQYYTQVAEVEAVILWDMGHPDEEDHYLCYCVWADTEELLFD
tara:strand:- start:117 stop:500 length:384 start_codon:yes stop_codon:yes gene_type:complete